MTVRQVALPVFAASFLAAGLHAVQQHAHVFFATSALAVWSLLLMGAGVLAFVLNPGVVLAGGYWVGRRTDLAATWRTVTGWAFGGGVAGHVAGGLAGTVAVAVLSTDPGLDFAVRGLLWTGFAAVTGSITAAVAALAGASVGYFSR